MTLTKKILLVDDDRVLRQSLAEQLAAEFATREAETAAAALAASGEERFDAFLLDVGLPDMNGQDLCRELRSRGVTAPIVMLTGATSEADTIKGLDSGANDYVAKPFRLGELMARLKAQLRAHEASEDAVFAVAHYRFQPGDKLLIDEKAKRKIRLTEKEVGILRYLLRAGGEPVSREKLLGEVWGYNAGVNTHTLETHVYRLRQKIERNPAEAAILLTVPGGYRLVS